MKKLYEDLLRFLTERDHPGRKWGNNCIGFAKRFILAFPQDVMEWTFGQTQMNFLANPNELFGQPNNSGRNFSFAFTKRVQPSDKMQRLITWCSCRLALCPSWAFCRTPGLPLSEHFTTVLSLLPTYLYPNWISTWRQEPAPYSSSSQGSVQCLAFVWHTFGEEGMN